MSLDILGVQIANGSKNPDGEQIIRQPQPADHLKSKLLEASTIRRHQLR
jgi:hypothetical protein